MKIYGNPLLEKALSASWIRNEAISENISNVDTPGYKRKDLDFQSYLKAAIEKETITGAVSQEGHISIGNDSVSNINFKVLRDYNSTAMRMDGNNVDIDKEMSELAKNQVLFNTYVSLMNKDFGRMKSAIRGGS